MDGDGPPVHKGRQPADGFEDYTYDGKVGGVGKRGVLGEEGYGVVDLRLWRYR